MNPIELQVAVSKAEVAARLQERERCIQLVLKVVLPPTSDAVRSVVEKAWRDYFEAEPTAREPLPEYERELGRARLRERDLEGFMRWVHRMRNYGFCISEELVHVEMAKRLEADRLDSALKIFEATFR